MDRLAFYALLAVTPAAAFWGFAVGWDWLARHQPVDRAPAPENRSIEALVRDLRRLNTQQRRLHHDDPPAKAARLRSLMLAYDDTLLAAGAVLGLPQPHAPPLPDSIRLELELALTEQGLVW